VEKTANKISYLEGIRGLAALLVFFHHFALAFYPAFFNHDPSASHLDGKEIAYGASVLSVFSNGNFCVCIFFVLSGFVLSRKYFQTNAFSVLVSGTQRRFVRLYIPIAVTILLAFMLMQAGLFYNVPASALSHSEWWLGNMWNFPDAWSRLWRSLVYGTMFNGDSSFDTTLSSMSIEFYGSLFVFGFLALTHNTRNRFPMLILSFLCFALIDKIYYATFIFGMSLNYAEARRDGMNKLSVTLWASLLLIAGLVLGSYPTNGMVAGTCFENLPPAIIQNGAWAHIIGGYFLVLAFVLSNVLQRIISFRVFIFLGYLSFALYLLHTLLIGSFSSYVFMKLSETMGYNPAVMVVLLMTTLILLPLSWLMTKYVDVPGTRFSKYVYERWGKIAEPQKK
jgi:peptidoglycan/LPS O-acetylase OafA/YrhL